MQGNVSSTRMLPQLASQDTHGKEEIMFILWWIIVGLIAGWLTGKIMSGGGYGAIMDIVIGIIGALIGGFIMRSLGFAGSGGLLYTILVALFGAILLTLVLRLFTRGRSASL
jgi:uncharacterized membrane protein YeaQ/YmgE (transglycosylase-associated protein family)